MGGAAVAGAASCMNRLSLACVADSADAALSFSAVSADISVLRLSHSFCRDSRSSDFFCSFFLEQMR